MPLGKVRRNLLAEPGRKMSDCEKKEQNICLGHRTDPHTVPESMRKHIVGEQEPGSGLMP